MDFAQYFKNMRKTSPMFMEYSIKMSSSGNCYMVYENWTYDSFRRNSEKLKTFKRVMPRYFRDIPQEFIYNEVQHMNFEFAWN